MLYRSTASLDPDRATPLDHDLVDMRVGDDRQIRPLSGRLQIGSRRRAALTVLLRRKDAIDAALAAIAIILVQRNACGNDGVDHLLAPRLRSLRSEDHTSALQSLMRTSYAV